MTAVVVEDCSSRHAGRAHRFCRVGEQHSICVRQACGGEAAALTGVLGGSLHEGLPKRPPGMLLNCMRCIDVRIIQGRPAAPRHCITPPFL